MSGRPDLRSATFAAGCAAEVARDACESAAKSIHFGIRLKSALTYSHIARATLDELDAQLEKLIKAEEAEEERKKAEEERKKAEEERKKAEDEEDGIWGEMQRRAIII